MRTKLTGTAVAKLTPRGQRREIADSLAPGLYLIIQPRPRGTKSWALRFRRPDGRTAKMVLGRVDLSQTETADELTLGGALTLRQARELANRIDRERARGVDVIGQRKAEKHRERAAAVDRAATTFGAVVRRYIEEHAKPRARRWQETTRVLGLRPSGADLMVISGGLVERWADKPVRDIDGHDIWTVLEEARRIGFPGIAARNQNVSEARGRRQFAALSSAFGWMQRHRLIEINPCTGVRPPPAPQARDRVLTNAEIRKFWRAAEAERPEFAVVLKLLVLTGQRLNEVARMERIELSDDRTTWMIPGQRTKNGRPHVVALSSHARELLSSVPALSERYVFSTDGRRPVSIGSKIKARLDSAMDVPPWRLHDLRRTFVTGMAELGIRADVIELSINHISGARGGIAGVYNRSELMPDRRAAVARWSKHVAGIVSPQLDEKVVAMRSGRR